MYAINLRLKYNFPALPILADRNGEAISNWTDSGGNQHISVDATHVHTGANAYKISASGAGGGTNYVNLVSTYCPAWVATKKYCITFWGVYCSTPLNLNVAVTGDAGMVFAVTNTLIGISYTFTGIAGAAGLALYLSGAGDFWFDDITVSEYTDLPVLIEKGMSDPDMYEFFPPIQNNFIDGGMQEQFTSFRRKIMFFVGVIPARADRLGILYWQLDNNRQIDYLTEYQVPVSPNWHNSSQTTGEYSNTWEQNFSGARSFTFELLDSRVWTPTQGFPN